MTERMMAVFHLSTGHVVGAMTAGRQVPTVAQATGVEHIAVRIPGGKVVRVPADLLEGLATPVDEDVLERPTEYHVTQLRPPVSWIGKPEALKAIPSKPGAQALSIWDGDTESEAVWQYLDNAGALPSNPPSPFATHRLVAIEDVPLMYEP